MKGVPLTLDAGENDVVELDWTAVEGDHEIELVLELNEDSNPANNRKSTQVSVAGSTVQDPAEKDDDEFPYHYLGLAALLAAIVIAGVLVLKGSMFSGGGAVCPRCGEKVSYYRNQDDSYCWECEEYVGVMNEN